MIRIAHKRGDCIGCAACTEIAPEYWEMDEDGLATLIEVSRRHAHQEFGEAPQADEDLLQESADCCPVSIIDIS